MFKLATKTWGGVVLAGVVERADGEGAGLMELQLKCLKMEQNHKKNT